MLILTTLFDIIWHYLRKLTVVIFGIDKRQQILGEDLLLSVLSRVLRSVVVLGLGSLESILHHIKRGTVNLNPKKTFTNLVTNVLKKSLKIWNQRLQDKCTYQLVKPAEYFYIHSNFCWITKLFSLSVLSQFTIGICGLFKVGNFEKLL